MHDVPEIPTDNGAAPADRSHRNVLGVGPRDRSNKRYYKIELVDRIPTVRRYLRNEGLSPEMARAKLIQVMHGNTPPTSRREVINLLDKPMEEVRATIALLDRVRKSDDA
ncbi:MAG TPA: hypothetical protein PKI11_14725 [Candidatus Hydrogenedentes bacterium]|nr:hypothetical protein [Candidatus Hydrogenedentota bacterium]HNT86778.1 hypothetical protein [Candidatus Hydrogenedentota bacterium]